jgi:hypothetical protein
VRKREVSRDELNLIIALRERDTSWLKVQKETSVPRHIAKRAYEQWQRSQAQELLSEVRKKVAAEEFRKHLDVLTKLADSLVLSLRIPASPFGTMKAEELLNTVWQRDLSNNERTVQAETGDLGDRNQRQTERRNRMLFQSLQEHTRGKVRWEALDEWKKSWDNCIDYLSNLNSKCREVMDGYLSQKKDLTKAFPDTNSLREVQDKMSETVLELVWRGNPGYDHKKKPKWFYVKKYQEGVFKVFAQGHPEIVYNFGTQNLGRDVADVCDLAAFNLFKTQSTILEKINHELNTIRKNIDDLEIMLDPLRLRPLILSSRCELCPA